VSNSSQQESPLIQATPQQRQRRRGGAAEADFGGNGNFNAEVEVGRHLRKLRTERGLSIRALAEFSGLNVNTLSLIENGKTSPSVSTLQQLAATLGVPITAFFEVDVPKRNVSYLKAGQRPRAAFAYGTFEDLGVGLTIRGGQPLIVTLKPDKYLGASAQIQITRYRVAGKRRLVENQIPLENCGRARVAVR